MSERVKPEKTLAIILGASMFPHYPALDSSNAFSNSAARFCKYLTDADGFGLPSSNLLNLFDLAISPTELDHRIAEFLQSRASSAQDIIVYYVGHGGFTNTASDYYLALRSTTDANPGISSLRILDLAQRLKESARHLRRYLILDSCFAAAAHTGFMSSRVQIASKKTLEAFPTKGTALLCSSGPRDPAKAPRGERYTMFSGTVLDVLHQGSTAFEGDLSLQDLAFETKELIRKRYKDDAVKPEVHSPEQREGDIGSIPLFPNPAWKHQEAKPAIGGIESARREVVKRWSPARAESRFLLIAGLPIALLAAAISVWLHTKYWVPLDPLVAVVGFQRAPGKPEIQGANLQFNDALEGILRAESGFDVVHGSDLARVKLELSFPQNSSPKPTDIPELSSSLGADLLISGEYEQWVEADGTHLGILLKLYNARGNVIDELRESGKYDSWFDTLSRSAMNVRKQFKKPILSLRPLTELADLYPRDEQARLDYFSGLELVRGMNAQGGLDALRRASQRASDNALVHAALSDAWSILRHDNAALEEAKTASALASRHQISAEYRLSIEGRAAEMAKNWSDAANTYNFLLRLYPRGIVYGLRLASVQIQGSDASAALQTLSGLQKLPHPFGDDPRIYISRSDALEALGNHEDAVKAAKRAIDLADQRSAGLLVANANLSLCWAYRNLGRHEDAFLACQSAKRDFDKFHDNVSSAVAQNRMAALDVDEGKLDKALGEYQTIIKTTADAGAEQDHTGALINAAGVLLRQNDPGRAREYLHDSLNAAIKIGDKYDQALSHILLGDVEAKQGHLEEAEKEATTARTLAREIGDRSTEAYALSNMGQYQVEQGQLETAAKSFSGALEIREALKEKPEVAACYSNIGDIAYRRGDLKSAEHNYKKAIDEYSQLNRQSRKVAELQLALGQSQLERQAYTESTESVLKAISEFRSENDSDSESDAASVLVRSLVAQNHLEQASSYVTRIQEIGSTDVDVLIDGAIARAEFLCATQQSAEAKRVLQKALDQASGSDEKFEQLQARLALLRIELRDGGRNASWRSKLARVRTEAAKAGFGLIVSSSDKL